MRRIAAITSTRADYSLLKLLIEELYHSREIDFQLLVTGTHLSEKYGHTVDQIVQDGFTRLHRLPVLVDEDSPRGVAEIMARTLKGLEEKFNDLKPDLTVVLGDRFEMMSAAQAAMIRNIPIAHIHGGEATEGLIDEAIRNSITKMSHLHFATTEEYKKRIIQMGEQPSRVFNFGAPALELMEKIELLSREKLNEEFGQEFLQKFALVTYHPVTLSPDSAAEDAREFFTGLESVKDLNYIITWPNVDVDNHAILKVMEDFGSRNKTRARIVKSLGPQRYFSLMKFAQAVIGNSSSGIIEAPFYKIPTVNVGIRQEGRIQCSSVISVENNHADVENAIRRSLSGDFKRICATAESPYYQKNTAARIAGILKTFNLNRITKKKFYDLDVGAP
jgi:GDP/UDP-N,N'-diacetylbacillosamine 2-epimerase (hydrolysing)